jgi:hypothetical protein
MNDRVSKKPPVPYIGGEDELGDSYDANDRTDYRGRKLAQPGRFTHHPNASIAGTDRSEASRHSSIFRFGKSIASTFNPSKWKIWSKQQQQQLPEDEETAQLRALKEQKEKAERIYRELKDAGHFRYSTIGAPLFKAEEKNTLPAKHDSTVDLGEKIGSNVRASREMSREDKRRGMVFLDPPKLTNRDPSPAASNFSGSAVQSNPSTPNRPFHFKKASLSNIKKALIGENVSETGNEPHQARRIPSRKDLQKQQKLVKRVSDLEGKLEAARRQLSEVIGEPVPPITSSDPHQRVGRPRFVPGALSTLPSERLLSGYVEGGFSDNEADNDIGKAITADDAKGTAPFMSDARASEEQSDRGINGAPPPAWVGKPLKLSGGQSDDHVVESVEKEVDETSELQSVAASDRFHAAETATSISEPTTRAEDPNDSDYQGEKSDKESAVEARAKAKVKPQKTLQIPKPSPRKRKSNSFERLADDGGIYKPNGESDSDGESEVKKGTQKKNIGARPRKLQKVSQDSTVDSTSKLTPSTSVVENQSPPQNQHTSVSRATGAPAGSKNNSRTGAASSGPQIAPRRQSLKGIKHTVKSPPPSGRLVKSQKGSVRRQSVSPPPASDFTGLDYVKPSTAAKTEAAPQPGRLAAPDVAYSADPCTENGIPPMPKMPKAVRLPSGEVINTAPPTGKAPSNASSGGAKLTKKKPAERRNSKSPEKENQPHSKKSFEWPEDVF